MIIVNYTKIFLTTIYITFKSEITYINFKSQNLILFEHEKRRGEKSTNVINL